MLKIIADINTILELTYQCGRCECCDYCVLVNVCNAKGKLFHNMPDIEIDVRGYTIPINKEDEGESAVE